MPFLTQWQVNGNEYFLDGSGNKVAIAQYEYNGTGVDNFRRIASSTCSIPFVRSFKILKEGADNWNLTVNQNKYIGRYPSQDAAVQVLVGLATRSSGSTVGLTENFDHQLSFGSSNVSFIPSSISGLAGWWDASDSGTLTLNNASVTQWNDKSGNSRHVSQSTAANQPSYSTSRQINSVNVLDFDGTNDLLSFSTPYTSVNGISAVVIFAPDNVIGGTNIYEGRNALASWESGNLRDFSLGVRTSALSVYAENGLSSREAVGNAMWNGFGAAITYGESNATHTKAGLNGQDPALTTGSRADLRLGGFGKDPVGGTIHFDGAIAEILLYDVASISTEQRQKLEGYVAHKWNLNASLPVGHPHKITAP